MRKFMFVVASAVMCGVFATASLVAQEKTAPAKGQAGQVNAATPDAKRLGTLAITGNFSQGYYCTTVTPNVHVLGWVPSGLRIVIQFDHLEGGDPIATLTAVRMAGLSVGQEWFLSDDQGGNLNPEFDVSRSYNATYILTVSEAFERPVCYSYKMWIL